MAGRRARSEGAKADRRLAIVTAAGSVFDSAGIDGFRMADVAGAVGLSKAALYRYFSTRESLLLALTVDELDAFFDRVDLQASASEEHPDDASGVCAEWVCGAALASRRLIRLQGLTSPILERNIDVATAIAFKTWLMERCVATGTLLAARCAALPETGVRFLIHFQLLVVGLDSHLHPAPPVAVALETPALAAFRLDGPVELRHGARALARATLVPTPTTPRSTR